MKILNLSRNTLISNKVEKANTFFSRIAGLLNRKELKKDEALIISNCQCIHMFFMRFAIDAIFVDKRKYVVGLAKNIKPFQISPIFFKANLVIEVPVGTIKSSYTEIGDQLELEE